jgi:hypothetical protein
MAVSRFAPEDALLMQVITGLDWLNPRIASGEVLSGKPVSQPEPVRPICHIDLTPSYTATPPETTLPSG